MKFFILYIRSVCKIAKRTLGLAISMILKRTFGIAKNKKGKERGEPVGGNFYHPSLLVSFR